MKPVRLIQVGMGGWGRDWLTMMATRPVDAEVVACVDVQPKMLEQLRASSSIPEGACFASLEAAIEHTDAEAVLITTALAGHVPVAIAALQAGKHVLVEKPFAPSVAEAQQVVELAAQQNRVLMVSQNYRYYPAPERVAALIRDQSLGAISAVNVQFRKYANIRPRGTNVHYTIRHPLLLDMAIHHFDLMRFVLDQEPIEVTCHAWNPPWSNFDEAAAAVATITFDGGAVVNYQGNWVSTAPPTRWAGAWQMECENGIIEWTSRDDLSTESDGVIVKLRGKRARRLELPITEHWDRAGSLHAFATAIRNSVEPPSSGRENLGSLALTFAAIESAESGLPQRVDRALADRDVQ